MLFYSFTSTVNRQVVFTFAEANMERDKFMSPQEAKEFGLIDHVRDQYQSD